MHSFISCICQVTYFLRVYIERLVTVCLIESHSPVPRLRVVSQSTPPVEIKYNFVQPQTARNKKRNKDDLKEQIMGVKRDNYSDTSKASLNRRNFLSSFTTRQSSHLLSRLSSSSHRSRTAAEPRLGFSMVAILR